VKHLAAFLRSVIPADPSQLLFLIGIVCLVIAPRLRWWPAGLRVSPEHLASRFDGQVQDIGIFLLFPIMFASVAGYFVCFWPGGRPTSRILCTVCLPATGGFGLMLARFLYLTTPYSSVLETTGKMAHATNWVASLWKLPAGFNVCLLGLLLILIFTSRLSLGIASLPLALPGSSILRSADDESWRRVQVLIWVLVGPLFLLYILLAWLTVGIPISLSSRLPAYLQSEWFSRGAFILDSLPLGFVLWIAGKRERQLWRAAIRLPQSVYFAVALMFPIGIGLFFPAGQYLVDCAVSAAHAFGRLDPPQLGSYFDLPDPWLLLLFLPAFFEEMIFRGLPQPRFLQKYGLYRGIFLVGMVWAAFHLFADFSFSRASRQGVLLSLRLLVCISHSFVFG
jgi:membrane protease YdiL (CAAX protease family)